MFRKSKAEGSDGQKREFEAKVKQALPQTTVYIMAPFTAKTIMLPAKP